MSRLTAEGTVGDEIRMIIMAHGQEYLPAELCRILLRKLDAVTAERDEARALVQRMSNYLGGDNIANLWRDIDEATAIWFADRGK